MKILQFSQKNLVRVVTEAIKTGEQTVSNQPLAPSETSVPVRTSSSLQQAACTANQTKMFAMKLSCEKGVNSMKNISFPENVAKTGQS